MPKFNVYGKVVGSKYLGEFEAATAEEAVEKAMRSNAVHVSMCHQCSDDCEGAEVESAIAEPVT